MRAFLGISCLCISALLPTPSHANCAVIDRFATLQSELALASLTGLRSFSAQDQQNTAEILRNLSYADIDTALRNGPNNTGKAEIRAFLVAAKTAFGAAGPGMSNQLRATLLGSDMARLLQNAANGIKEFDCSVSVVPINDVTVQQPDNDRERTGPALSDQAIGGSTGITQLIQPAAVGLGGLLIIGLGVIAAKMARRIAIKRKRRSKRYIVNFQTKITVNDAPATVKVRDLSCLGLKIDLGHLPMPNATDKLTLALEDDVFPVSLIWANAFSVGLKFSRPVALETVHRLAQKKVRPARN